MPVQIVAVAILAATALQILRHPQSYSMVLFVAIIMFDKHPWWLQRRRLSFFDSILSAVALSPIIALSVDAPWQITGLLWVLIGCGLVYYKIRAQNLT